MKQKTYLLTTKLFNNLTFCIFSVADVFHKSLPLPLVNHSSDLSVGFCVSFSCCGFAESEFLREFFEAGIPVTHGSDSHKNYKASHLDAEKYLIAAGFTDGDISEIAPQDLW